LEYIRQLQPYDVCILDPDVQQVSDVHAASPESEIVLRRWEWDDGRTRDNPNGVYGKLAANPEALAQEHVTNFSAMVMVMEAEAKRRGLPFPPRAQLSVHLVNEPDTNSLMVPINRYTIPACRGLRAFGVTVDALNLGTGHPAILNRAGEPDWTPFLPALDVIEQLGCYAVTHEYFNTLGIRHPRINPWHVGRTRRWLPRGPKCKIGEFGVEQLVDNLESEHQGWNGRITAEQYLSDIEWYLSNTRSDTHSVRIFMTDFRDRVWQTYDTFPIWQRLVTVGQRFPTQSAAPPSVILLPALPNDGPTPPPAAQPPQPGIIDPAALGAILEVESNGNGFINQRLVIRFEAHIFARELQDAPLYVKHFRNNDAGSPWLDQFWRPTIAFAWRPIHTGHQADEWAAFEFARSLNETVAMRSISMGAPQIMGFNHARIGYPTVQAMFTAFDDSYPAQLIGLVNFILSDDVLVDAIRRRDWLMVARLYNGPGQVAVYAPRLEKAYRELNV